MWPISEWGEADSARLPCEWNRESAAWVEECWPHSSVDTTEVPLLSIWEAVPIRLWILAWCFQIPRCLMKYVPTSQRHECSSSPLWGQVSTQILQWMGRPGVALLHDASHMGLYHLWESMMIPEKIPFIQPLAFVQTRGTNALSCSSVQFQTFACHCTRKTRLPVS